MPVNTSFCESVLMVVMSTFITYLVYGLSNLSLLGGMGILTVSVNCNGRLKKYQNTKLSTFY